MLLLNVPNSGSFTLTVVATDTTPSAGSGQAAGLNQVVFPATVSNSATHPQTGANNVITTHVYTFDANDVASAVYAVTVTDERQLHSPGGGSGGGVLHLDRH